MFKKVILSTAILASSVSFAMNAPAPYIGAGLGIVTNTSDIKGSGSSAVGNYRGVPFNVFAGYGGVINQNFYLAGELSATLGTADIQDNGLKTSYGYGVSVLPGMMLSDHTLAFARAGIVRAHLPKQRSDSTGGELGLGLQTSLTQCIDLRGEYDFVAYRSVNGITSGSTYSVSPRSDQVNLGLIYKFD
jgi:opacity protein-like surface antigen